jgi:hypothetical protein
LNCIELKISNSGSGIGSGFVTLIWLRNSRRYGSPWAKMASSRWIRSCSVAIFDERFKTGRVSWSFFIVGNPFFGGLLPPIRFPFASTTTNSPLILDEGMNLWRLNEFTLFFYD